MTKVKRTNEGKVFWPGDGLTKGDLLAYLDAAAHALVPALRDRPLSLKRYPDGIDGQTFFQKNTPAYAPSWLKTVSIHAGSARRDVRYALCNDRDTLLWLGNQGTIEFHPWPSRADRLERPDQLIFDFDPPEGDFRRSVAAALAMREVLQEAGLAGAAKTSGSKGVHLYVPIERRRSFGEVRAAAARLASRLEEREPDLVTTEFSRAERGGRVLIDIGRNAPAQHIAAAYSPRARPGGTVSFPVPWEDLPTVDPAAFTITSVPQRLANGADPWRDLLPRPQRIPAALLER